VIGWAQDNNAQAPQQWNNWSGSVSCTPRTIASPTTEEQVVKLVADAHRTRQTVRVAASGHSFVPICASDGTLLSLDGLKGIVSTDQEKKTATFLAGTKIYQMGEPLLKAGLAMENMGDIDRQGIAGAISTGTHGTGKGIGSISTQVVGLRLITASGETLDCSAESQPDVFKAAKVSLGSLGIITQVTLRCLPAYRLHEKKWEIPFAECIANLDDLIAGNRHFEFFWRPRRDVCSMKSLNPTDETPSDLSDREGERIGHSHLIFPSERNNKFNEIEFALPEESGLDCLQELRELMLRKHQDVLWPLEYRTLAADDILISPAQGRETITISAHQAHTLPHNPFFADVEAIFRNHRGRPHWGKMHTHTADELSRLYPKWEEFHAIRRQLDPHGRFLNDFLRRTFV
jgi:FAD/FMN-containing dehydrogenase